MPVEGHKKPKVLHVNRLKPYYEHVSVLTLRLEEEEDRIDRDLLAETKEPDGVETMELPEDVTWNQQVQLREVLQEHSVVFNNKPGRTTLVEHSIHTGHSAPIQTKCRPFSGKLKQILEKEIQEMLELDVIEPAASPWSSVPVVVGKKGLDENGDPQFRICVDFRPINKITTFDAHPLPRVDDLLDQVSGAQYISCLDLSKGFWQVPLAQDSKCKTAFSTPFGQFQFKVLPFGLANSPATFQRLMNLVLCDFSTFAIAYLDDICIFSNSWEEHLKHLDVVLTKLQQVGLMVKLSKCQFAKSYVDFLGFRVGRGQIQPLQAKVKSVLDWEPPKTKKFVSIFGLVGLL